MSPRVPVPPSYVDEHGVVDPACLVPDVVAARERLVTALERIGALDPVAQELCRLLNARRQRCAVCMRWRYTDADDDLLSATDGYEDRSDLSDEQRDALRLADAYLRDPGVPDDDARAELLAELGAEGIAEVLFGQFRFTWNKTLVALGFDGEAAPTP